jgi:hypothetical protein
MTRDETTGSCKSLLPEQVQLPMQTARPKRDRLDVLAYREDIIQIDLGHSGSYCTSRAHAQWLRNSFNCTIMRASTIHEALGPADVVHLTSHNMYS